MCLLADIFQDPEINGQYGTQKGEIADQVSELIVQRNKNKEQFQFSQGIWDQTKEDTVVLATAAMETGAILEHQLGFHWRKMLIQITASRLLPHSPGHRPHLQSCSSHY